VRDGGALVVAHKSGCRIFLHKNAFFREFCLLNNAANPAMLIPAQN